jgi:lipopolysaccharide/colanic/teichoic acid biosynthesis glycosyltransferase
MSKRAFDVVFSFLGLVVFAPLAAVIAVLVKLETPGPILTSRTCVGRHGQPFTLYHFRTMTVATSSTRPQRTPLGRVLCNYTLNDYPTFWSVLGGNMSIVGPRPERPEQVNLSDPHWQRVLTVKPGLVSQAILALTDQYNATDRTTRMAIELAYVEQQSLAYDMHLLVHALQLLTTMGHIKGRI